VQKNDLSNNPVGQNRLRSPEDVIGWREAGLVLNTNFFFGTQRPAGFSIEELEDSLHTDAEGI